MSVLRGSLIGRGLSDGAAPLSARSVRSPRRAWARESGSSLLPESGPRSEHEELGDVVEGLADAEERLSDGRFDGDELDELVDSDDMTDVEVSIWGAGAAPAVEDDDDEDSRDERLGRALNGVDEMGPLAGDAGAPKGGSKTETHFDE